MKRPRFALIAGIVALGIATTGFTQENKLRLITWADYVPADVVAQFKKETGIDVEVTLSNNEEMISKLRATGGAGFDLAQPSQDRIIGPQQEFGIYKPIDTSKIKTELFIPSMLDATKKNTTLKGQVYGLPHIWGTDGLVVNTKLAKVPTSFADLYKQAMAGEIGNFTGVSDPYEAPENPAVEVRTDRESMAESAAKIVDALRARGLA